MTTWKANEDGNSFTAHEECNGEVFTIKVWRVGRRWRYAYRSDTTPAVYGSERGEWSAEAAQSAALRKLTGAWMEAG